MKRLFAGTCLAAVCAVGLAAQSPGQSPAQSPAAKDDKEATITGCLRAGDQPNSFVLENVKWDKGGSGAATGTTGSAAGSAPGSSASAAAGQKVRLIGSPAGTKLEDHIGHTVQVTGKLGQMGSATGTSGAGTGTGTAGTGTGTGAGSGTGTATGSAARSSMAAQQSLNVDTVKMVSTTCQQQ
ncbi:MAG TPA: hypothetical protein VD833_15590 [Vicinamibacterales bacterium]|nr:hypothetical protein [Vicinamibacterales bacterium]